MAKYKVILDREACIGAAACAAVGPQFWKMVEDGKVDLIGATYNNDTKTWDLIIDEKDFIVNQESAQVCPVNAIKVVKIED